MSRLKARKAAPRRLALPPQVAEEAADLGAVEEGVVHSGVA